MVQQLRCRFGIHRARKQEALHFVAAEVFEGVHLFAALDAFDQRTGFLAARGVDVEMRLAL